MKNEFSNLKTKTPTTKIKKNNKENKKKNHSGHNSKFISMSRLAKNRLRYLMKLGRFTVAQPPNLTELKYQQEEKNLRIIHKTWRLKLEQNTRMKNKKKISNLTIASVLIEFSWCWFSQRLLPYKLIKICVPDSWMDDNTQKRNKKKLE